MQLGKLLEAVNLPDISSLHYQYVSRKFVVCHVPAILPKMTLTMWEMRTALGIAMRSSSVYIAFIISISFAVSFLYII